jgi:hypothetical protein
MVGFSKHEERNTDVALRHWHRGSVQSTDTVNECLSNAGRKESVLILRPNGPEITVWKIQEALDIDVPICIK